MPPIWKRVDFRIFPELNDSIPKLRSLCRGVSMWCFFLKFPRGLWLIFAFSSLSSVSRRLCINVNYIIKMKNQWWHNNIFNSMYILRRLKMYSVFWKEISWYLYRPRCNKYPRRYLRVPLNQIDVYAWKCLHIFISYYFFNLFPRTLENILQLSLPNNTGSLNIAVTSLVRSIGRV